MGKRYLFNCGHSSKNPKRNTSLVTCPVCKNGTTMALGFECQRVMLNRRDYNRGRAAMYHRKREASAGKKEPKRNADCKHYDRCLSESAFKNKKLACSGCEKYQPVKMDVMDFARYAEPVNIYAGMST